jgi:hypothetical protein
MLAGGPGRPPRLDVQASRLHAVSLALPPTVFAAALIVIVYA